MLILIFQKAQQKKNNFRKLKNDLFSKSNYPKYCLILKTLDPKLPLFINCVFEVHFTPCRWLLVKEIKVVFELFFLRRGDIVNIDVDLNFSKSSTEKKQFQKTKKMTFSVKVIIQSTVWFWKLWTQSFHFSLIVFLKSILLLVDGSKRNKSCFWIVFFEEGGQCYFFFFCSVCLFSTILWAHKCNKFG